MVAVAVDASGGDPAAWQSWVVILQMGLMGATTIIIALLFQGFRVGKWAQAIDPGKALGELKAANTARFDTIDDRFDTGSAKMSELAGKVQKLIVDVAEERARREEAGKHQADVRAELDRVWKVIDDRRHAPRS